MARFLPFNKSLAGGQGMALQDSWLPMVTDFTNGFELSGDTYTGGPVVTEDNTGALVTSPAGVLPITGMRLATTVAEGATLGPELVGTFDFTVAPWTTLGAVTDLTPNSFTTSAGGSGVLRAFIFNIGKRYSITTSMVGNGGSEIREINPAPHTKIGDVNTTFEFVATGTSLYIRHALSGTTTANNISIREVIPTWLPTDSSGDPIHASTPLRTTKGTVSKYAETYRGPLIEPARTNKCTCYSVSPANSLSAEISAGSLVVGRAYQITTRTTVDFTADGAASNDIGTSFIATSSTVTLDANNKVKRIQWMVGEYSHYNGSALIQNIDRLVLNTNFGKLSIIETPKYGNAIFVGDSITYAYTPGKIQTLNFDWSNIGVEGAKLSDTGSYYSWMDHYDAVYAEKDSETANVAVVLLGTNDMAHSPAKSVSDTYDDLVEFCQTLQSNGLIVVVGTILDRLTIQTEVLEINTLIRAGFGDFADYLVDYHADARLADASDTTYFSDGTHLTTAGKAVMTEVLTPVLGQALEDNGYGGPYQNKLPAGSKIYRIDARGAGGDVAVQVAGTTGNMADHFFDAVVSGKGSISRGGGSTEVSFDTTTLTRKGVLGPGVAPTTILYLKVPVNNVADFCFPNMQEGTFQTSIIETSGTSLTRPAANLTRPTAGTSLAALNNWATLIRFRPTAAGQTAVLWGSYTDADNATQVDLAATTLTFKKRLAGVDHTAQVSLTHASDTLYEALFYQHSVYGMGIAVKSWDGSVWSAWSSWATNADTQNAPIASTYQIGARNNASHFAGNYPFTEIIKIPASVEPQAWLMSQLALGRI